METDPKKISFWQILPYGVKHEPVPLETCRTVFPKFDIGQWHCFGIMRGVVFATIEGHGRSEARVLHPHGESLAIHCVWLLE